MDGKSWTNLVKTEFKVGEHKLNTSGLNITHEAVDAYYSSFSAIQQPTRVIVQVTLLSHYRPERVAIEGDAELVHAILEKLRAI